MNAPAPTDLAAAYAHYDSMKESNPVAAANFAESVRLFASPRPPAQSPAVDTTGEREAAATPPPAPDPRSIEARMAALRPRAVADEKALASIALAWSRPAPPKPST